MMEPLTWTGTLGPLLMPVMILTLGLFILAFLTNIAMNFAGLMAGDFVIQDDGTLKYERTSVDYALWGMRLATLVFLACCVVLILGGFLFPTFEGKGIIGSMGQRFWPVWIGLIAIFALSIRFKRKLGLYGKLFDSTIGMIGFGLVLFWMLTAIFAFMIAPHDPLHQIAALRNQNGPPGAPLPSPEDAYPYYLLGGDRLGRDVFSRMVFGAREVLQIAPLATLFAFMVGVTLGLPAGYVESKALQFGRTNFFVALGLVALLSIVLWISFGPVPARTVAVMGLLLVVALTLIELDTNLTFIANLILAFPVILLFYLLVTPEMIALGVPQYMAMVLFLFPIIFLIILFNSRYHTQPMRRNILVAAVTIIGLWIYFSLVSDQSSERSAVRFFPEALDLFDIDGNLLIVFVSVVFVNSPTVFRIVRGITLDIKTRDYVAAAQTRGESAWYIMLWEILPNARGPLIVDFCLRIGYTTILLGTLGFFGLGVSPESPDWGSTINEGRRLLTIAPHPALPPALALMSLVLGLNLLADGLREESLKD